MKVLLINDDGDPKNLAYYIGQFPDGHYATVEAMFPFDHIYIPNRTRARYIVLDFEHESEKIPLANNLAIKFPNTMIILVDNEFVQPECPHNLIIVSKITQAAEYIFNNA